MDAYKIACEIDRINKEIAIGVQGNGDDIFTVIGEYNGTRQIYEALHSSLRDKSAKLKEALSLESDVPALIAQLKAEGKDNSVLIIEAILRERKYLRAEKSTNHIVIIPPSGFPPCIVTRARLDRARELIENGEIPSIALMPFPQKDTLGYTVGYVAAQMFPNVHIIVQDTSWGTWGDTATAIAMAKDCLDSNSLVHVHFVTDKPHLIRCKLAWRAFAPKGWTAEFHAAKWNRPTKDYLYEMAAIVKYSYLLLKHIVSK